MIKVALFKGLHPVLSSFEKNKSTSEIYNASGIFIDIITYLMSVTNSSFQFVEANGYAGAVGQLYRREADIAAIPLTISDGRLNNISFLPPFQTQKSIMIMSKDAAIAETKRPYAIASFSTFAWLLIGAVIVLAPFVTHGLLKTTEYFFQRSSQNVLSLVETKACSNCGVIEKSTCSKQPLNMNLSWWLNAYCSMTLTQGLTHLPTSAAPRVILCCYWITILMLSSIYSGQLTAITAVPRTLKIPVNTLEELARSHYYLPYVRSGSVLQYQLQDALSDKLRNPKSKFTESFSEYDICVNLRAQRDKVLIFGKDRAMKVLASCQDSHNSCDFVYSDDLYLTDYMSFGIRKGLPHNFVETLRSRFLYVSETGLFDRQYEKANSSYTCPQSLSVDSDTENVNLALKDLESVFIIWSIGVSAGILVFVVELLIKI